MLGKRSFWVGLGIVVVSLLGFSGKAICQEEDVNLAKNPGFEEVYEKEGTIVPEGWNVYEIRKFFVKPDGTPPKLSIDDQVSHSGKCSLKITGMNNHGQISQSIFKKDVEELGYEFTGKYRLSGWIKTYNMGAVDAELRVSYWERKNEKERWKWITGESIGKIQGTTDWTKVSKVITTPSDSDFGLMQPTVATVGPNSGLVWFDDISLVKLEAETIAKR